MADKIREIQDKMKSLQGSNQLLAASSYFPLFGWIYPLHGRKDDDFCQFHGKQGLQLNSLMLAIYFVVWILENFPIVSWFFGEENFLHPVSRTIWLVTAFVFIVLSIFCAYKALMAEKWEIPELKKFMDKIFKLIGRS